MMNDVRDFHLKFQVPLASEPSFLDMKAHYFRFAFLHEELKEFNIAYESQDLEGAGDALIDLVYVALGTALMMGLPWQEMWDRVQTANMAKRLAKPDGSDSKRGNPLDVVKPPGWVGPDHSSLLPKPYKTFNASKAVAELAERRRNDN